MGHTQQCSGLIHGFYAGILCAIDNIAQMDKYFVMDKKVWRWWQDRVSATCKVGTIAYALSITLTPESEKNKI